MALEFGRSLMTWQEVAAEHIGHKAVLRDARTLECVSCSRKLLLPRERSVVTSGPPPYRPPDTSQAASPEVIAKAKREALANLAHAKQRRTTVEEQP